MIEIDMETAQSGAARILVVEDEILIRLMIADALRDLGGALVVSAATADEAWQYLVVEHHQADIVFTHHRIPGGLTGLSSQRNRRKLPQYSGHRDIGFLRRDRMAGADPAGALWFGFHRLHLDCESQTRSRRILNAVGRSRSPYRMRHPTPAPSRRILAECGCVVHEAANGEEVKAALGSGKLNVGIVFADMTTVGSGFQLQAWIKSPIPAVEVILAGSIEKALDQAGRLCKTDPRW